MEATGLSLRCSVDEAMSRYVTAATSTIKHHENLFESLEGLECLILLGVYHINAGNMKPAWMCFRQCVSTAQLMGLHCGNVDEVPVLDPESISSPSLMWYRIVHQDRYLSLMLGVPGGTSSVYRDSDTLLQGDCATGRLECMHSAIMGRIITRNEGRDFEDELKMTQEIDLALQKAARSLLSHWWLLPNALSASINKATEQEQLEDIMRTLVQLTHFHLLVLLHLPYMMDVRGTRSQQYSKTACANASRELLNRYTRFRSLYQTAFCCRSIDFSAFTASLALILTHLQSNWCNTLSMEFLSHQRLSDRAMIEESINLMLQASCSGQDAVSQHTCIILRCLLDIETEATERCDPLRSHHSDLDGQDEISRSCVHLTVPYLGKLEIASDGITAPTPMHRGSKVASPMPVAAYTCTAQRPRDRPKSIGIDRMDNTEQSAWDVQIIDDELLNDLLDNGSFIPGSNGEDTFDISTLFSQ